MLIMQMDIFRLITYATKVDEEKVKENDKEGKRARTCSVDCLL